MPPLVLLGFLDELWSGVPIVQAPAIELEHGLSHGGTGLLLLTLPQLAGAVVEARVLVWAHGRDPRRFIVGSLVVLALAALLAALSSHAWALALALVVAGPASGCACALAEASLVESQPHARERQMTLWTFAGAMGDLSAPILVALVGAAELGWRAALMVVAGLVVTHAIVVARCRLPPAAASDDHRDDSVDGDDPEATGGLRPLVRNRALLWWLAGTTACALLDEILVALAALRLRRDFHASEPMTAVALAAWAVGCGVGLLATSWLLTRIAPRRVLAGSALACTIVCTAWLVVEGPVGATVGLFVLGLAGAPLYPIASAQAYATCPGRATLVGAVAQLFAPVEIALPWLLGAWADVAGLQLALVALAAQPLVLLALALLAWPSGHDGHGHDGHGHGHGHGGTSPGRGLVPTQTSTPTPS